MRTNGIAKNKSGDEARTARVNEADSSIKSIESKLEESWLTAVDVLTDVAQKDEVEGLDLPNSRFMYGKYLPTDRELDRRLAMFLKLPGDSQFGKKEMPVEMLMNYTDRKQKEARYRSFLDLGAQLINQKDPESMNRAFAILPELQQIPQERSIKRMKFDAMLEAILRSGVISSREELMLIFVILDPRVKLPTKSGWQEILGFEPAADGTTEGIGKVPRYLTNQNYYGWFSPYTYAPTKDQVEEQSKDGEQWGYKVAICRRLFPGLRNAEKDDIVKFLGEIAARNDKAGIMQALMQNVKEDKYGFNADQFNMFPPNLFTSTSTVLSPVGDPNAGNDDDGADGGKGGNAPPPNP